MPTIEQTAEIVQQAILGTRRGIDIPMYKHSIRVGHMLRDHGFSEEVQMAGMLHDIVEDGDYTFEQLKALGYSDHTIELVHLSTFDLEMGEGPESRRKLVERLILSNNTDAWAIKLADMGDNLSECHHLELTYIQGYLFIKAPVFIYYGNKYFGGTDFYNAFLEIYREQVKRYHKYFG